MSMVEDRLSDERAYELMVRIRRFEETVLEQFRNGVFDGTTHTYIGQEANAVAIVSQLGGNDTVFSNHRCHGHFIAYGGDLRSLFAELMGKATGVCGGRGGSQHIHWKNFYSSGVLGSTIPVATGVALANRLRGKDDIVVVFMGDGTLGEGVVYESLNMAGLWSAPILFVVENNRIAQTTPIDLALSGEISDRFDAFGVPAEDLASSDVLEIQLVTRRKIAAIRAEGGPRALVIATNRFAAHSKGDDTRSRELVTAMRSEADPLDIHGARINEVRRAAIDEAVADEVRNAFETASADPDPVGQAVRA